LTSVIEMAGVAKQYAMGNERIEALHGITLRVNRGEYISILGPSGSGKTTLLNLIGGLDLPTRGTVFIENEDISKMSQTGRTLMRCQKIGYIFQTFNLIDFLSAIDNVALPMVFAGKSKRERLERARELLQLVDLGDRLNHKPTQLSGGQQQRVAIARALANSPSIILADEPTGNLDLATGLAMVQLLYRLRTETDTTVICATHDLKMIAVSDRIAWLEDGTVQRVEDRQGVTLTAEELQTTNQDGERSNGTSEE
jgi:putative ABC transport system ATP-binding protein